MRQRKMIRHQALAVAAEVEAVGAEVGVGVVAAATVKAVMKIQLTRSKKMI